MSLFKTEQMIQHNEKGELFHLYRKIRPFPIGNLVLRFPDKRRIISVQWIVLNILTFGLYDVLTHTWLAFEKRRIKAEIDAEWKELTRRLLTEGWKSLAFVNRNPVSVPLHNPESQ